MKHVSTLAPDHIQAEVIADSYHALTKSRLTSVQITLPRFILAEFNTHKVIVKNFASSRAIPSKVLRRQVFSSPFIPVTWGVNRKGMSACEEAKPFNAWCMRKAWIGLSKVACFTHWFLEKLGLHKQTCNRLIEPWLTVTGIATASNWDNFFALRCSPDAQPEMRELARCIQFAIKKHSPTILYPGMVHAPYIREGEKSWPIVTQLRVSAARCCRASYDKLGKPSTTEEDILLYEKLHKSKHYSPMEHSAFCLSEQTPKLSTTDNYFTELPLEIKHLYLQRNFVGTDGLATTKSGWAMFRACLEPVKGDINYICNQFEDISKEYYTDKIYNTID